MTYSPDYTVYLVRWPDGVAKVGFTTGRRWTRFRGRGARVLNLWVFDDCLTALSCEAALYSGFGFAPAFETNAQSHPYVGSQGGGYKECFIVPQHISDDDLVAMMRNHPRMLKHRSSIVLEHVPPSNARTDGPTDGLTSVETNSESSLDVTRATTTGASR